MALPLLGQGEVAGVGALDRRRVGDGVLDRQRVGGSQQPRRVLSPPCHQMPPAVTRAVSRYAKWGVSRGDKYSDEVGLKVVIGGG